MWNLHLQKRVLLVDLLMGLQVMNLCVSLIALVATERSALRMGLLVAEKITRSFTARHAVVPSFPTVNLPVPVEVGHLLESLAAGVAAEGPVARVHQVMSVEAGDAGESPGAKAAFQILLAFFYFVRFTFLLRRRELQELKLLNNITIICTGRVDETRGWPRAFS